MNFSYYFLLFTLYSILGWLCEVVYCSIPAKRFINRGFLKGPVCPVYGFGGMLIVFLLKPYAHTWIHLFFAAVVVTSALEYLTSWILETLFNTKWWDYSHYRFNIHGRVCLLNSVLFGLLGVVTVHFIQPFFSKIIISLHTDAHFALSAIIAVLFAADLLSTLKTMMRLDEYLVKLQQFGEDLKERYEKEAWFRAQNTDSMFESVREKLKTDAKNFSQSFAERFENLNVGEKSFSRLITAFPGSKSKSHNSQLELLKARFADEISRRRELSAKTVKTTATAEKNAAKATFPVKADASKRQETQFAAGLNGYKLFWIFFIGCILGTIVETMYCVVKNGYIQNRAGVIYGPFNPVYGFGAVLMTCLLFRLRNRRDLAIFGGSMLAGGAFEYCCSLFQELVFHTVSWEYSASRFNLHGRTSLLYCVFWGILGLLWVKELFPIFSGWIERIPAKTAKPLTWLLAVFMLCNMTISALAVKRMSQRSMGIEARTAVEKILDAQYPDSFLNRVYPNMIHRAAK